MSKILVTYFSASGVTAKVAAELARAECADRFEIKPETPYTKEDLDYTVKTSRSNVEKADAYNTNCVSLFWQGIII